MSKLSAPQVNLDARWRICRCHGRPLARPGSGCIQTSVDELKQPDLAIYNQTEILGAGGTPSWDSPDIISNDWSPFRLMNEITASVSNLSPDAHASNALVNCFIAPFGIGMHWELFASKKMNIPAGTRVDVTYPIDATTKSESNRVGVRITIEHPHDSNLSNNSGDQIHDGYTTGEAGRDFSVDLPVRNNALLPRTVNLQAVSADIVASVSPSSVALSAFEETNVTVSIGVPSSISGMPSVLKDVTVIGTAGAELIGGATILVRVDS